MVVKLQSANLVANGRFRHLETFISWKHPYYLYLAFLSRMYMASKAVVTLGDGALDGRVERHGVCQQRGDGPRQVRHGAVGARRRAVVQVLAHAGRAAAHQGPATSLLLGTT